MSDITIVMIVCLLIWGGIFIFLLHLDRQLKKIKQKIEFREDIQKNER